MSKEAVKKHLEEVCSVRLDEDGRAVVPAIEELIVEDPELVARSVAAFLDSGDEVERSRCAGIARRYSMLYRDEIERLQGAPNRDENNILVTITAISILRVIITILEEIEHGNGVVRNE